MNFFISIIVLFLFQGCSFDPYPTTAKQITFGEYSHSLDNNDNFSPDNQWLVYDTRAENGGIRMGQTIERVNIHSGQIDTIYRAPDASLYGPGLGAVSYNPIKDQVIFIHGLLNPTKDEPYTFTRRFGAIVDIGDPSTMFILDARDVSYPYTQGALRGGTHRHEFSGDGTWVGYTYNDAIMAQYYPDKNLRTVGVSKIGKPVFVNPFDRKHISGISESVVAVSVTPNPIPGSNEISHAADDSWVGKSGYINSKGKRQRARAFLGDVISTYNQKVKELFIVDIPEQLSLGNQPSIVAGTLTDMPTPPASFRQRRLTWTAESNYPGCSGIVRSSSDGSKIAYLSRDENGIQQIFLMSPLGGQPEQITHFDIPIQSGARWHPNGTHIIFSLENRIIILNIRTQNWTALTTQMSQTPSAIVWSKDGKTIGFNLRDENNFQQIYILDKIELK